MTTITFSTTFNINEMFKDPQVRVALRAREMKYQENMRWLDEDLVEKEKDKMNTLFSELKGRFVKPQENLPVNKPKPKIWHCGHGASWERSAEDKKRVLNEMGEIHRNGIKDNTCLLYHHKRQLEKRGFNTHRQYTRFENESNTGDIIFLHCSKNGGLTHWGVYNGNMVNSENLGSDGLSRTTSKICVEKWNKLPTPKNGVGRNWTLYEVNPNDKNYENYMIFT